MLKARFGIAAASVALVAAGLLVADGVGATAAEATSCTGSCLLVDVTPQSVPAGESQAFTVTVTNDGTEALGSVQLTAPSDFAITGAPGSASYTSGSAQFENLQLPVGGQVPLTVDATAACSGGTSAWGVQAVEQDGLDGDGDDVYQLDPASNVAAAVSGNCSLAFSGQPNGTTVGAPITTQVGSAGSPVSVEVLDGVGNLLTGSTAAVTVAVGSNPGSGTLSGTKTVDASAGVAKFSGLSINQTGTGYALGATSPGITSATSSFFDIWGVLQGCSGPQCSGSSSTTTTTGSITTSSATSGDFLGVGLGGVSFSCGSSYQPLSDPLSFDVLSPSGVADSSALFTVSLEVAKSVVESSGHPAASSWQICFGSNVPFTALRGTYGTATIGGVTYYTGLLPDCKNTQTKAPCVQARHKDNAGDEIVTFLGSGDAFGKM
jgi:hypothetical protein